MLLSGLVGFLLVLTADARVGNSSTLNFCFETEECLLFDLICDTGKYEVRHYESVKWVTTEEETYFLDFAAISAFRRLFNYIKDNKVEMTAPVLMKMENQDKAFWQKKVFRMSFLLPSEHQASPPAPTDDKVEIVEMPAMNVYVRSFGGWMTATSGKSEAKTLSTALHSAGAKYKTEYYYSAGYNSPMTLFNRHNEVWFVVEDDPVCPSSEELD